MFFFRYKGDKFFTWIGTGKYYPNALFTEQMPDGTYQRPLRFFFENRKTFTNGDFDLIGVPEKMFHVKYTGIGDMLAVRVGGTIFKKDEWVEVPIDFDSFDDKGDDQFLSLGFKFRMEGMVASSLDSIMDGERILVIRKYGGLGDILMQSMIFPEIRCLFPRSEITYAIPPKFMELFDGCRDIDRLIDVETVQTKLYRMVVAKEYAFIGDISTSCAAYEVQSIKEKGHVDKERSDIWAESMGLKLRRHKTCLKAPNKSKKREYIGIAPRSNCDDRNYPDDLTQELIDKLVLLGHKVRVIHNEPLKFRGAETISGLSLKKLGEVVCGLKLLISVDSGPLHYAGIFGIPVIGIFGMTESDVRLSYYDSIAVQGKCHLQQYPCWGGKSNLCKVGSTGIAKCMFINPDEIVKATRILCD